MTAAVPPGQTQAQGTVSTRDTQGLSRLDPDPLAPSASTAKGSRVLAVINPASGDADPDAVDPVLTLLNERMGELGVEVETIPFAPDILKPALLNAIAEDVRSIYVAGGDGTVLAVAEALGEHRVPIGIIPRGTMNWLARDLGIPLVPEEALEALVKGEVHPIDVGEVNGHIFLCACMIGFGPLVARRRERERETASWRRWPKVLWQGLKVFRRYGHLRVRLITDERTARLRSRQVVVTTNLIDSAFELPPRRNRLDAGILGIYGIRKASALELTRLLTRIMSGTWQMDDAILSTAATEAVLEISSHGSMMVLLDGEIRRLKTPLRFSIQPKALEVLVPAT
jgi:diacylglycerol kinase family enzyme